MRISGHLWVNGSDGSCGRPTHLCCLSFPVPQTGPRDPLERQGALRIHLTDLH